MKAIVTLTIGDKYVKVFENCCKKNWKSYADKFGYELIAINEPLDNSERARKRSPAWQKLLILSQDWSKKYERIVWIDTDILINIKHAYDICSGVPVDKVGAVEAYSMPTRDINQISLQRLYDYWKLKGAKYIDNIKPESYYLNRGLPGKGMDNVVQTGVFVCSPKHHKDIFEYIYNNYEDTHGAEWNYEMPAMSYELEKNDMVYYISPSFNFNVLDILSAFYPEEIYKMQSFSNRILKKLGLHIKRYNILKNIFEVSIFLHFAGCADLMTEVGLNNESKKIN